MQYGPFLGDGLDGMLETSKYDSLDWVSSSLGAIADAFCRNLEKPKIAKLSTLYANLLRVASWYDLCPG